jgi:hypothetical protein
LFLASSGLIELSLSNNEFVYTKPLEMRANGCANHVRFDPYQFIVPLYIKSLHFNLIYPSTYIISLSPTWVSSWGLLYKPLCLYSITSNKLSSQRRKRPAKWLGLQIYSASKCHLSPRCPHNKPIKPSTIIQEPMHHISIVCL